MPWSERRQPASSKNMWRTRSASITSANMGTSTAIALSGRHVGSIFTLKPSAFTLRWCSSESIGSSVVQTVSTL